MIIRCWGARGSIPVFGKEYIRYGGNTTSIELKSDNGDIILVDAGSGIRGAGNKLLEETCVCNILFTHFHWDHILGFVYFKPAYFKKMHIDVFGCPVNGESLRDIISGTMIPPYFPLTIENMQSEMLFHQIENDTFNIGSMTIKRIPLSHPNHGYGYSFEENGKKFVFLTDNEIGFKHDGGCEINEYKNFCNGADVVFHDAMFTSSEYKRMNCWGHSSCLDAISLAKDSRIGKMGLFHHHPQRSDDAIDDIVKDCQRSLIELGSKTECIAVSEGLEIIL
ncbi:MAG: MBL fold metallo-hydrolase [Candidatus Theseobacter exili]|nr:MBL fold metallo-hydrolase [Candidatus Theseobacter exili]